jgi:hypothetical protein
MMAEIVVVVSVEDGERLVLVSCVVALVLLVGGLIAYRRWFS